MEMKSVLLTASDLERLQKNLAIFMEQSTGKESPRIKQLDKKLQTAQVVDPEHMPANIVTMHSKVLLEDSSNGYQLECTLVYPSQSNAVDGKISVLSAMGLALLGAKIDDEVVWEGANGPRCYRLIDILEQGILKPQHI